jgi:Rieske Fe-S protein
MQPVSASPGGPARLEPSRRGFLNWLLGTSAGALAVSILYPILRFVSPPRVPEATTRQVDAGSTHDPELLARGFKIVRFGNEPVIIVRAAEGDYRAFTATCTHLDCIVEFRQERQVFWCNCHNGQFDLTGRNIAGPPPRALTALRVHVVPGAGGGPGSLVVERG